MSDNQKPYTVQYWSRLGRKWRNYFEGGNVRFDTLAQAERVRLALSGGWPNDLFRITAKARGKR